MVANDVFRGRYRKSFEHPQAIVPNTTDEYTIDLHTQSYRFLKGHRIRVQVQSSWFPLIDRNPQTFVPNIYDAKDTDFKAATMKVYRTPQTASYISLPIAGGRSFHDRLTPYRCRVRPARGARSTHGQQASPTSQHSTVMWHRLFATGTSPVSPSRSSRTIRSCSRAAMASRMHANRARSTNTPDLPWDRRPRP